MISRILCVLVMVGLASGCASTRDYRPVQLPVPSLAHAEVVAAIALHARAQKWSLVDVDPSIGVVRARARDQVVAGKPVREYWSFLSRRGNLTVWRYTETLSSSEKDTATVRSFPVSAGYDYRAEQHHLRNIAAIMKLSCSSATSVKVAGTGARIALSCQDPSELRSRHPAAGEVAIPEN